MKKIIGLCLVLAFGLSACACPSAKLAVNEVERSHEIISKQLLKYVEADTSLSKESKDDWKKLVESDKRNIYALKKAMESED